MSQVMNLSVDMKILCKFQGLYYAAKVVEATRNQDGLYEYLLHYPGWNKSYDEWILETDVPKRVKEFTEEGLARAKEEVAEVKQKEKEAANADSKVRRVSRGCHSVPARKSATRRSTPTPRPSIAKVAIASVPLKVNKDTNEVRAVNRCTAPRAQLAELSNEKGRGTKRRAEEEIPTELKKPVVKLSKGKFELPTRLKDIIKVDEDLVTRQSKLYRLPAKYSLEWIIHNFRSNTEYDFRDRGMTSKELRKKSRALIKFGHTLQDIFDCVLPCMLLYPQERCQYSELVQMKQPKDKYTRNGNRYLKVKCIIFVMIDERGPSPFAHVESKLIPSRIYSLPHFLRLLNKMEDVLTFPQFNDQTRTIIEDGWGEFVNWLSEVEDYFNPNEDYFAYSPEEQDDEHDDSSSEEDDDNDDDEEEDSNNDGDDNDDDE